ncbi:MAG: hypothetical protein K0V04_36175, partial [Deltaproteobacteria bacterium]|nr:hypothetical protein [Deltaproteobacteria bacterium]
VLAAPADGPSYGLPAMSSHGRPSRFSIELTREGDCVPVISIPASPRNPCHDLTEVDLEPGDSRRELFELAHCLGPLPTGSMTVKLSHDDALDPWSASASLVVADPGHEQAALLARLRGTGPWEDAYLATDAPPDLDGLRDMPRRTLMLFEWLRAATTGPTALAALPDPRRYGFTGPREAEASALAYELAVARADPRAPALRDAVLSRWPGLLWRCELVDEGRGRVAALRRGRERRRARSVLAVG